MIREGREEEAAAEADAAFGRAADSGKPSCAGELLVFRRRHDAPPQPQHRRRHTRLFLDTHPPLGLNAAFNWFHYVVEKPLITEYYYHWSGIKTSHKGV